MARESKRTRDEKRFGKSDILADNICTADCWIFPKWMDTASEVSLSTYTTTRDRIVREVEKAPIVDISNIGEYFYAVSNKEYWEYQKDFPYCRPPFDVLFMEMRRPTIINSEGTAMSSEAIPEKFGWLFKTESRESMKARHSAPGEREAMIADCKKTLWDLRDKVDLNAIRSLSGCSGPESESLIQSLSLLEQTFFFALLRLKMLEQGDISEAIPPDIDMQVSGDLVIQIKGKLMIPATCNFYLNKEGGFTQTRTATAIYGSECFSQNEKSTLLKLQEGFSTTLFPMLMAMSFMNCKNTTTEPVEPDAKTNRVRIKAALKPFLRYHTINIEPMKKVLKTEGGVETNGLKKALHICRGHFARYSEDKPLFGHTSGLVWRPAHTRGSIGEGIVVSDYKVNAPKETV